MNECKHCGFISSNNVLAMWTGIIGYHPAAGYTKPGRNNGKMIPEHQQFQGYLCAKCMKSLSAYKIEREYVVQLQKEKREKILPLNLWDAFH